MKTKTRNAELGAIHAARRQLGLAEEEYRDLLQAWTGKSSAAKLSEKERRFVIDCFRKMGFRRLPAAERRAGDPQIRHRLWRAGDLGRLTIAEDDKPMVKKIKVLWLQLHRADKVREATPAALAAFVKRQTGIASVDWLVPEKAGAVIEAL